MKKFLLPLSVMIMTGGAFSASAANWTLLTDNSKIPASGIDAVIAYNTITKHYVMGTEQSANYRNAIEVTFGENSIPELPEGTAIVKLTPTSQGFTLYVTNGEATGYLTPKEGAKYLNVQESPAYASISTNSRGSNIVFKGLDEKNELACMTAFAGGISIPVFQCVDSGQDIQLYIDEDQLGAAPYEWSASPAAGSMNVSFDGVTLTLPEGTVTVNSALNLVATLNGESIQAPAPTAENAAHLVYSEPLTTVGEYKLVIPAGYYTITPENGTAYQTPEMVYEIIIGERGDWTANPANGSEVQVFSEVIINFPGSKIAFPSPNATGSITATFNGKSIDAPTSDISNPQILRLHESINEPGEVVINIPANWFMVNYGTSSTGSKAVNYTVNIVAPIEVKWEADPENGSTQKTVENILFSFPDATKVALNENADMDYISATLDGKKVDSPSIGRNDLQFVYRNPIARNGKYVLTIKEGLYDVTINGKTVASPEIVYTLNLEGNMDQTYTVTPEAGSYDKYPTVTLTYDNVTNIEVEEGAEATLKISTNSYPFAISAEGNVVTLTPQEDITTWISDYTVYELTVPEGAYYLTYSDGTEMMNDLVTINNIKVAKPVAARVEVILPEGTYNSFQDIKVLEFISPVAISTFDMTKKIRIYSIKDGERTEVGTYKTTATAEDKKSWTSLISEENLPGGDYVVVIPENFFTTYNEETKERLSCGVQEFFYTLDIDGAVDSIFATDATVTVYNVAGVIILKDAEASAFNNLPAGLYIVNGKKVIKK